MGFQKVIGMTSKRAIDIQRNAAITLHVGGDDKSAVMEFLSTGNALYAIKEAGVYKIQLADDIDPARLNPNIPNLNQQVLTAGHDNEIVAKILLTAKYLFDEKNATVKPFVADLFEKCLVLTKLILELDAMTHELKNEIGEKEAALAEKFVAPNAVILPSIPGMDTKLDNILSKADKAKDTLLAICRLQFLPNAQGKPKLEDLEKAVEQSLSAEPQLIAAWKETAKYFSLIRNMRNVSEHPKDKYRVVLKDFSMWPDGKIYPPLVEIQHPDTPIRTLPLVEFLDFVRNTMLEHAEVMLAFVRFSVLLQHNPFKEWVAEFPEDERRHKFVRYYRAINMGGRWRILG